MDELKAVSQQTFKHAIRLVGSVILLALAVGLSLAVEELVALSIPRDSKSYAGIEFVLEFCLIGSAAVNAVLSCFIVVADSWTTFRSLRSQEETS